MQHEAHIFSKEQALHQQNKHFILYIICTALGCGLEQVLINDEVLSSNKTEGNKNVKYKLYWKTTNRHTDKPLLDQNIMLFYSGMKNDSGALMRA